MLQKKRNQLKRTPLRPLNANSSSSKKKALLLPLPHHANPHNHPLSPEAPRRKLTLLLVCLSQRTGSATQSTLLLPTRILLAWALHQLPQLSTDHLREKLADRLHSVLMIG